MDFKGGHKRTLTPEEARIRRARELHDIIQRIAELPMEDCSWIAEVVGLPHEHMKKGPGAALTTQPNAG